MSFKLPHEIETLGANRITDIDEIKDGDILVIPSKDDEPRLRVRLSTLSKWGLLLNGRHGCRKGRDSYIAVKRAFGDERWDGFVKDDAKSHAFVFKSVFKDENDKFVNGPKDTVLEFSDANSIGTKAVVRDPKYPYMTSILEPLSPNTPTSGKSIVEGYPYAFSETAAKRAYDIFMKEFDSRWLMSSESMHDEETLAQTSELSTVVDLIELLSSNSILMKRLCGEPPKVGSNFMEFGPTYVSAKSVSSSCLVARGSCMEQESYSAMYFPYDRRLTSMYSIHANRKFIEKILSNGALVFRSEKLYDACCRIHSAEVAKEMSCRERSSLDAIEKLLSSLRKELPKARELQKRLSSVCKKLSLNDSLANAIRKVTTD